MNETVSKHFYTRVESGTYLLSDSYLLPVNISEPQDLPDESRVCSVLLFRSLIKNRIKWEGWSYVLTAMDGSRGNSVKEPFPGTIIES